MKERKNSNITIYPFIFALYVVNIVFNFSYHHYNFKTQGRFVRSIQKMMIVTVDAYK